MRNVTAVIMGGGRGARLFPLTLERAKPAVGFAGKYRLIDIPISNCIHSEIRRMFVLTQFLSASLHRHLTLTYRFDVFSDGFIDILAAEQTPQKSDWFQGTADAVRATLNHTTYLHADHILILAGDHLYRMDYRKLVEFHRDSKADITVCVTPVTREEAPEMGLLRVAGDGRIDSFVEKPKDAEVLDRYRAPQGFVGPGGDGERYLASMGVYLFEPKVLNECLADSSRTDFGGDIIPAAIDTHRVMAYPFEGYWKDIGTIGAYYRANIDLVRPEPSFSLYEPGWPIFTRTRSLPPSRVIQSEIKDSLLVEGSSVRGAEINESIVGLRGVVRNGSLLKNVVMLGSDYYDGESILSEGGRDDGSLPPLGVGRDCRLERVILDKNVRIGNGVVIRPQSDSGDAEGKTHWVRNGITVVPKGTVIPDGTVI